jgi:hypothetical protein
MKTNHACILVFLINIQLLLAQTTDNVPAANTQGTLTITTTEISSNSGNYSPSHCTAVWIQNASGQFVKTLYAFANTRKTHLNTWEAASSFNVVDATTGATKNSFETHTFTWNGTNAATPRVQMPDGIYTVKMELTCKNATGNVATFTFTKGPDSQTLTPTNQNSFTNVSIKWVPVPTAIDEVRFDNLYEIYPNPVKTNINVKGPDFISMEIINLMGEKIKSSSNNKMNMSALPKGHYLIQVKTGLGTFTRKIVKR